MTTFTFTFELDSYDIHSVVIRAGCSLQTHGDSRHKAGRIRGVQFGFSEAVGGVEAELLGVGAALPPALPEVCAGAEGGVCVSDLQRSGPEPPAELLRTHLLPPLPPTPAVGANTQCSIILDTVSVVTYVTVIAISTLF